MSVFLVAWLVFAQDTRTATLVGAVTDSTGSVVPGAAVTITNVETPVVSKGVTNSEGSYYVAFLAAGAYDLTVEAAGFKKHVQSGLVLRAAELRNRDRPSGKQIGDHLRNVHAALPSGVKQIFGRADSDTVSPCQIQARLLQRIPIIDFYSWAARHVASL